jgi:hypothetical protein
MFYFRFAAGCLARNLVQWSALFQTPAARLMGEDIRNGCVVRRVYGFASHRAQDVMKNLTTSHLNEFESDRRSIKDRWYGTNAVGKLYSRPFGNREDCLSAIHRRSAAIDAYRQPNKVCAAP